jgi:hypothetical protein
MLHNNTSSHTAAHTAESIHQLRFKVLKHPPNNPDLASSDYHMFGPLKDVLRSCHFPKDPEVKETVNVRLVTQSKTIFYGIQKLVNSLDKCIEKNTDCRKMTFI